MNKLDTFKYIEYGSPKNRCVSCEHATVLPF